MFMVFKGFYRVLKQYMSAHNNHSYNKSNKTITIQEAVWYENIFEVHIGPSDRKAISTSFLYKRGMVSNHPKAI